MRERIITEQIYAFIRESATVKPVIDALDVQLHVPTVAQYVRDFMQRAKIDAPELFARAGIERSMGYKILSGRRQPGRDTLLRLAFVLRMELDDAQRLLAIGGHGALYPRSRRDLVLIHGLTHQATLDDIQERLQALGEASLWNGE